MEKQTAVQWYIQTLKEKSLICAHMNYTQKIEFSDVSALALHIEKEQSRITEDTSDGYHTFKVLYQFRKMYNAALFNEWALQSKFNVHKSWRHHDGELCFDGAGYFIVCAELPSGQISNHYMAEDWDLFKIPETEKALIPFDGHTADDVLDRLRKLNENYI